jgi:Na+-driven multidrug efflux pump
MALRRMRVAALPLCALGAVLAGLVAQRLPWLADQQSLLWTMLALSALTMWVRVQAMTLVLGILRAGGDRVGVVAVELGGTLLVGLPLVTLAGLRWGFTLPQVYALLLAVEALKTVALLARMRSGVWRRSLLPPAGGASRPAFGTGAS